MQVAAGSQHCQSSSRCHNNHRIKQSTAGNPVVNHTQNTVIYNDNILRMILIKGITELQLIYSMLRVKLYITVQGKK